jgi:hypothetical protein
VTIAVVGNFTEGVIFAVDSAVSAVNEATGAVLHVFESGQKIYHIGKDRDCLDSPYGAMLFGSTSFSRTSWRNVFADFCNRYNPAAQDSAQNVVVQFVEYLRNLEPSEEKRPSGGVFLAGYGPSDSAVRCFKIDEHDLSSKEIPIGALSFDGIADIVQKHLFGIALRTKKALENVFGDVMINTQEEGGEQKQIPLAKMVIDVLQGNGPLCSPEMTMPLRDAIDYMHFLVYSTIKHFKFAPGAPICGGAVEIAAITRDRGFRRIRTKPLDSAIGI